MSDDFSLSIRNLPHHSVIECRGALDLLPAEKVREGVESVIRAGAGRLVLDCTGVSLLTSAGITALVDTAIRCREVGTELDLRLSSHVRRILDLVGLWWLGVIDDGIAVHESLQRALRSYADQSFAGTINGSDIMEKFSHPDAERDVERDG